MTQQENDELMYASPEDQEFYLKCVAGLPTLAGLNGTGKDANGIALPYGLGPHSVRCLKEVVKMTDSPTMLCIGTNMGWSDSMWLELAPKCILHSCDISYKEETIVAAKILTERYSSRYRYENRTENSFKEMIQSIKYGLCFIDGSHLLNDVIEDIKLAISLNIPWIAFDDYLPEFGEVQLAIEQFNDTIQPVKIMGNIALYYAPDIMYKDFNRFSE
jgi:hypothetical protein